MKIHFVSYGNVFRSRLAEAYLRFILRKHKNVEVISSGIHPEPLINGPISWYAMKILAEHELIPYMSHEIISTTKEILENCDLTIFLDSVTRDYCLHKLSFKGKKTDIWHTDYIPVRKADDVLDASKAIVVVDKAEKVFAQICENCSRLADELSYSDTPSRL